MGLFSFIGKVALGVAAVAAAPIVLPAAGAAAAAAGAAAAGAAATAATAVGSAVAATGAAAAAAAAPVGGAVAAGASTAAGVAAAAGAKVAAGAAVVGTKAAVAAGAAKAAAAGVATAKVAAGAGVVVAGGTGIYKYTEHKADEAEARGRKQGYKHGFTEGKQKAAKDLQELLEKNEKLRFGMFAMALHVARLDGEDEAELDYIEECLGNEELIREEVKHELQAISNRKYSFYEIRIKYLDKVSAEEMMYVDKVIQGVMEADGSVSEKERLFYTTTWEPYLRSLKKA